MYLFTFAWASFVQVPKTGSSERKRCFSIIPKFKALGLHFIEGSIEESKLS